MVPTGVALFSSKRAISLTKVQPCVDESISIPASIAEYNVLLYHLHVHCIHVFKTTTNTKCRCAQCSNMENSYLSLSLNSQFLTFVLLQASAVHPPWNQE